MYVRAATGCRGRRQGRFLAKECAPVPRTILLLVSRTFLRSCCPLPQCMLC
jgi:hypothetical protein